ncbi:MAG: hypothetical protein LPK09_11330 [Hymenobacteraceae bacterium]|nr:hypothetical protein [Hymenobacteraceae bacterium]
MNLTKEEFDQRFVETLDVLLQKMADNEDIDVNKFYSMACMLENIRFFSPVLYGVLKAAKK